MAKIDNDLIIGECRLCPYKDLYYCADCVYSLHDKSYAQVCLNSK